MSVDGWWNAECPALSQFNSPFLCMRALELRAPCHQGYLSNMALRCVQIQSALRHQNNEALEER